MFGPVGIQNLIFGLCGFLICLSCDFRVFIDGEKILMLRN